MKIFIKRIYYPDGTNGHLTVDIAPGLACYTIELPWKNNKRKVSCIPEGTYKAKKHHSEKHGNVLWLQKVPGRSMVYMHSANDALKELEGCRAPVTQLTGHGKGTGSRPKLKPILDLAFRELERGQTVEFVISS